MISVVVTLCHLIALDPKAPPLTACFDRVAGKIEIDMKACGVLVPGVVDWKEKSKYAGEDYFVLGIKCVEGDYHTDADL